MKGGEEIFILILCIYFIEKTIVKALEEGFILLVTSVECVSVTDTSSPKLQSLLDVVLVRENLSSGSIIFGGQKIKCSPNFR